MNEPSPTRASAAPPISRTLTTHLFEVLRSDILLCRLDPGSHLRFKELRERYRSGLSPIREALMRLVAEGLVVMTDHKGFRVAPVSRDEMLDIARTLFELEALAIRLSIERGDDEWQAAVKARFRDLSKRTIFTRSGELDPEWEAGNVGFHESLYGACGSPALVGCCQQLSAQFSRYRRLCIGRAGARRDVSREHEGIMKAVIARDVPIAVNLLRRHRETTIRDILAKWDRAQAAPSPRRAPVKAVAGAKAVRRQA